MSFTVPVWAIALVVAVALALVGEWRSRSATGGSYSLSFDGCGWWVAAVLIVVVTISVYVGAWIGGSR